MFVTSVLLSVAAECVTWSATVFAEILIVLKCCCFLCHSISAAFIVHFFARSPAVNDFDFFAVICGLAKLAWAASKLKMWLKHKVNYSASMLATFCKQNKSSARATWHELADHAFETPGPMQERKSCCSAQELRMDCIWVAAGEWTHTNVYAVLLFLLYCLPQFCFSYAVQPQEDTNKSERWLSTYLLLTSHCTVFLPVATFGHQ